MATLLDQLQRESEDLCGYRGLLAGTDEQTFSMALPGKLRNYYDKIVTPATTMGSGAAAGPRAHKLTGTALQQIVQAYGTMNKFLTRFLEHVSSIIAVTLAQSSIFAWQITLTCNPIMIKTHRTPLTF